MSTRSKYTPLRRGVANTPKTDADISSSDSAAGVKVSSNTEDGAVLDKAKSKVHLLKYEPVEIVSVFSRIASTYDTLLLCRSRPLPFVRFSSVRLGE